MTNVPMINSLKKMQLQLVEWQNSNPNVPEVVHNAIKDYRNQLKDAVIDLNSEPPFEKGDKIELISTAYEDSKMFSGDLGEVIDLCQGEADSFGGSEWDVRVEWDNGVDTCWISANDVELY